MTRKCPTCGGDGIVYSEASAAIDVERRLRSLVAGSRSQAFRIELAAPIASALVGPGGRRLIELEALTKRRFFLQGKPNVHLDHFVVLSEGKLADLAPAAPVAEGAELQLELVEVDRHDASAAIGKLDGFDVCVGEAAELVGKKVKVRVERVLDRVAYATLVRRAGSRAPEPLTAEAEAEKPTRRPPARKPGAGADTGLATGEPAGEETASEEPEAGEPAGVEPEAEAARAEEPEREPEADESEAEVAEAAPGEPAAGAPPKKKTRRGSRGGRKRKKKPAEAGAAAQPAAEAAAEPREAPEPPRTVTIHVPDEAFGRERADAAAEPPAEGEQPAEVEQAAGNGAAPVKKRTRRGSRGGRKRKRPAAAATNGIEPGGEIEAESEAEPEPGAGLEPEPVAAAVASGEPSPSGEPAAPREWGYVPMSEWGDELDSAR
jgi:predicted RNA-binding protein with TRAM domain